MSNQVHVSHNSGNNEWYTPKIYIDAARIVMGSIDLDPATSVAANLNVNAKQIYTFEKSGLHLDWIGNVWMNPPYSKDCINLFVDKFVSEYESGNITSGVCLVNNGTETKWGNKLLSACTSVCFVKSRIKFLNSDLLPVGAPLQGQMIVYCGLDYNKFNQEFSKFGACFNR